MFRFPIGFMAALGLVLGAYCVSRSNAAEESSAPAKGSSAANAPATQQEPAATASPAAAEPAAAAPGRFASGMGVGEKVRSLGNRQPAQPTVPSEPLAVLKSGPDHTRLVYRLKWTPATNVSQTVGQLLRQEGELHGTAGTAAKGGPALRVAIAPNVVTNCLAISGPPDAVEEVRLLAEKLDVPAPMVQFEMEMGEAPAGDAKHGAALASEGGAPPAERPNVFRILERPKTMQTTARARVLTLDNQPAFIQLGQRVPQVAGVSNNAASGTTQSVTMANVGLILGVTPRINVKEGIVVLQVDAEDSQLGPEKEGIPLSAAGDKAVRSPRIDTVVVQTTVMIPDGKTIILGSIARQGKTDKELVIILTPHIIPPEGGKKTGP